MSTSKITAKRAILIGQFWVNVPVAILLLAPVVYLLYPLFQRGENSPWIVIYGFLGIIIGLIPAWFYWSLAVPKWLVWAYRKVENKGELRHRAEEGRLLWGRNNRFGKTMLMSQEERDFIKDVEDNIVDYRSETITKEEIEIRIGHFPFGFMVFFMLLFFVGPVMVSIQNIINQDFSGTSLFVFGMFVFGTWGLFRKMPLLNYPAFIPLAKQYFSRKPLIIINKTGINIKVKHSGWIKWENIQRAWLRYDDNKNQEGLLVKYWINEGQEDEELKIIEADTSMFYIDDIELEQYFYQKIPKRPLYEDDYVIYKIWCYKSQKAEDAKEEKTPENSTSYALSYKIHKTFAEIGIYEKLYEEDLVFLYKGDVEALWNKEDILAAIEIWEEFLNIEDVDQETAKGLLAIYQILRTGYSYDTVITFA